VLDAFASDLETRLDKAVPAGMGLEAPALHRLNRTEYANAIRDLVALDVDVASLLPSDASSGGFDNIAEALAGSPSLVQGYVSAAMKISRRAVGDRTLTPTQVTYPVPGGLAQDRHIEGLPLGTRGGMLVRHTFPLDAEYELSVTGGGAGGGRGGGGGIDITLDGDKLTVTNPRSFRLKVTAGPHVIGAAVIDQQRSAGVDDQFSDQNQLGVHPAAACRRSPSPARSWPPARRHAQPAADFRLPAATEWKKAPCAKIITSLGRRLTPRAGRRRVETLMSFYQRGRNEGTSVASSRRWRDSRRPGFLDQEERGVRPGATLPDQRSRTGVAPVVLSLEQHPRR
jgi:hypothetical protein